MNKGEKQVLVTKFAYDHNQQNQLFHFQNQAFSSVWKYVHGLKAGNIVTCLGLFIFCLLFMGCQTQNLSDRLEQESNPQLSQLSLPEQRVIHIFKQASPSVVYITSMSRVRDRFSLSLYEREEGTGTGFIWDKEGHIVTNYHVIKEGNLAQVALTQHHQEINQKELQEVFSAKLVGIAPNRDLAVLKIDAPPDLLKALPVGNSNSLQVGQSVLAIGNPFGFDQTLTTGVISGLGREIKSVTQRIIKGVIQTDAAINPGNSGGPLLNSLGRLIGVNTAIYSPSGAYAGIGFAVPIDTVKRVVPQLIKYGREVRPSLGVDLDEGRFSRRYDLPGALILKVAPNGPAAQKGLRGFSFRRSNLIWGDFILKINDRATPHAEAVYQMLDELKVGEQVVLHIQRNLGKKAQIFRVEIILSAELDSFE